MEEGKGDGKEEGRRKGREGKERDWRDEMR